MTYCIDIFCSFPLFKTLYKAFVGFRTKSLNDLDILSVIPRWTKCLTGFKIYHHIETVHYTSSNLLRSLIIEINRKSCVRDFLVKLHRLAK